MLSPQPLARNAMQRAPAVRGGTVARGRPSCRFARSSYTPPQRQHASAAAAAASSVAASAAPPGAGSTAAPSASAASPPPQHTTTKRGGVLASLLGRPLQSCDGGRGSAVPLLLPHEHGGLPFAAALRIYHHDGDGAAPPPATATAAARPEATTPSPPPPVVELHYVLSGAGELRAAGGERALLAPGDSLIALQGEAQLVATSSDSSSSSSGLVTLQLLLPSAVLSGATTQVDFFAAACGDAGHAWAAAACGSGDQGGKCGSEEAAAPPAVVTEALLRRLLGGGEAAAAGAFGQRRQARVAATVDSAPKPPQQQPEQQPFFFGAGVAHNVLTRSLRGAGAFKLPQQSNRLALLFGPALQPGLSLTFGLEVFEPGHVTPRHLHRTAHELFFVLAGAGEGVWVDDGDDDGGGGASERRVALAPGGVAVFPPGVVHALDNPSLTRRCYCLQMMLPNEGFSEYISSGEFTGGLDDEDLCSLLSVHC